jgi:hypothetical protein
VFDSLDDLTARVYSALNSRHRLADEEASERRLSLLAAVLERPHLVVDGDGWYSCARTGEDCYDDARRDGPCDCGRDDEVREVLLLLADLLGA